jgi:hypothetical protein
LGKAIFAFAATRRYSPIGLSRLKEAMLANFPAPNGDLDERLFCRRCASPSFYPAKTQLGHRQSDFAVLHNTAFAQRMRTYGHVLGAHYRGLNGRRISRMKRAPIPGPPGFQRSFSGSAMRRNAVERQA